MNSTKQNCQDVHNNHECSISVGIKSRLLEQKYDRQMRVWGITGQKCIDQSTVLCFTTSPIVIHCLVDLVLANIHSYHIVDDVTLDLIAYTADPFITSYANGKNVHKESQYGEVIVDYLSDLNSNCVGHFHNFSSTNAVTAIQSYFFPQYSFGFPGMSHEMSKHNRQHKLLLGYLACSCVVIDITYIGSKLLYYFDCISRKLHKTTYYVTQYGFYGSIYISTDTIHYNVHHPCINTLYTNPIISDIDSNNRFINAPIPLVYQNDTENTAWICNMQLHPTYTLAHHKQITSCLDSEQGLTLPSLSISRSNTILSLYLVQNQSYDVLCFLRICILSIRPLTLKLLSTSHFEASTTTQLQKNALLQKIQTFEKKLSENLSEKTHICAFLSLSQTDCHDILYQPQKQQAFCGLESESESILDLHKQVVSLLSFVNEIVSTILADFDTNGLNYIEVKEVSLQQSHCLLSESHCPAITLKCFYVIIYNYLFLLLQGVPVYSNLETTLTSNHEKSNNLTPCCSHEICSAFNILYGALRVSSAFQNIHVLSAGAESQSSFLVTYLHIHNVIYVLDPLLQSSILHEFPLSDQHASHPLYLRQNIEKVLLHWQLNKQFYSSSASTTYNDFKAICYERSKLSIFSFLTKTTHTTLHNYLLLCLHVVPLSLWNSFFLLSKDQIENTLLVLANAILKNRSTGSLNKMDYAQASKPGKMEKSQSFFSCNCVLQISTFLYYQYILKYSSNNDVTHSKIFHSKAILKKHSSSFKYFTKCTDLNQALYSDSEIKSSLHHPTLFDMLEIFNYNWSDFLQNFTIYIAEIQSCPLSILEFFRELQVFCYVPFLFETKNTLYWLLFAQSSSELNLNDIIISDIGIRDYIPSSLFESIKRLYRASLYYHVENNFQFSIYDTIITDENENEQVYPCSSYLEDLTIKLCANECFTNPNCFDGLSHFVSNFHYLYFGYGNFCRSIFRKLTSTNQEPGELLKVFFPFLTWHNASAIFNTKPNCQDREYKQFFCTPNLTSKQCNLSQQFPDALERRLLVHQKSMIKNSSFSLSSIFLRNHVLHLWDSSICDASLKAIFKNAVLCLRPQKDIRDKVQDLDEFKSTLPLFSLSYDTFFIWQNSLDESTNHIFLAYITLFKALLESKPSAQSDHEQHVIKSIVIDLSPTHLLYSSNANEATLSDLPGNSFRHNLQSLAIVNKECSSLLFVALKLWLCCINTESIIVVLKYFQITLYLQWAISHTSLSHAEHIQHLSSLLFTTSEIFLLNSFLNNWSNNTLIRPPPISPLFQLPDFQCSNIEEMKRVKDVYSAMSETQCNEFITVVYVQLINYNVYCSLYGYQNQLCDSWENYSILLKNCLESSGLQVGFPDYLKDGALNQLLMQNNNIEDDSMLTLTEDSNRVSFSHMFAILEVVFQEFPLQVSSIQEKFCEESLSKSNISGNSIAIGTQYRKFYHQLMYFMSVIKPTFICLQQTSPMPQNDVRQYGMFSKTFQSRSFTKTNITFTYTVISYENNYEIIKNPLLYFLHYCLFSTALSTALFQITPPSNSTIEAIFREERLPNFSFLKNTLKIPPLILGLYKMFRTHVEEARTCPSNAHWYLSSLVIRRFHRCVLALQLSYRVQYRDGSNIEVKTNALDPINILKIVASLPVLSTKQEILCDNIIQKYQDTHLLQIITGDDKVQTSPLISQFFTRLLWEVLTEIDVVYIFQLHRKSQNEIETTTQSDLYSLNERHSYERIFNIPPCTFSSIIDLWQSLYSQFYRSYKYYLYEECAISSLAHCTFQVFNEILEKSDDPLHIFISNLGMERDYPQNEVKLKHFPDHFECVLDILRFNVSYIPTQSSILGSQVTESLIKSLTKQFVLPNHVIVSNGIFGINSIFNAKSENETELLQHEV